MVQFDLIFIPRQPGEPGDAARHRVQWERVRHRLASEMPTLRPSMPIEEQPTEHTLGDRDLGLALRCTPEHFVLTASTDRTGVDVASIIDALQRTAAIVETETGLVAYDPRSCTRFLHDAQQTEDRSVTPS